jgi:predicted Zn-dependent peptidase
MNNSIYHKSVLDNGIRVVTERIPYVRSVSLGMWLTVGSRDEDAGNNGISHFIEHMLFKGTATRSAADIAESLESVGGHLNAFTSKELTCYYAHILDEHLPLAVDVLSDIILNSVFDDEEVEKERLVILEELSSIEETPEELIHEHFMADLFPGNPLGFSIIGNRQTITSFDRTSALTYLSKHYLGQRLVVAATGNVDHCALVNQIEACFPSGSTDSNRSLAKPVSASMVENIIENGAIQAHVCLGTHAYPYANDKKFPLLVLNTLLGAGMSSRLFQTVREKHGLAYSIYSFIEFLEDTGLIGIYAGTDKAKIDDAVELIVSELKTLSTGEISDKELERTKSQLKGNLMLGLESTASRMNRLAKMEIYLNAYFTLDSTIEGIDRVTSPDVLAVASELFQPDRLCTTILKPKS